MNSRIKASGTNTGTALDICTEISSFFVTYAHGVAITRDPSEASVIIGADPDAARGASAQKQRMLQRTSSATFRNHAERNELA
jgi:hypothetical protein